MKLSELNINEDEFDIFSMLSAAEKIEFLFNAQRLGIETSLIMLISKMKSPAAQRIIVSKARVEDIDIGISRLCVTILDDCLTLNCDSLRAMNLFAKKVWRDGHLLMRDKTIKRTEDDYYRYFRAYRLLRLGAPLCEN